MDGDVDLDPNALSQLERLGGALFEREILALFLRRSPELIEAAHMAYGAGDLRGVDQAVHFLRSSAGNVGARTIQHLAEAIEQLAEDAHAEPIAPLLLDLQRGWGRLEPLIRQAIEGLEVPEED